MVGEPYIDFAQLAAWTTLASFILVEGFTLSGCSILTTLCLKLVQRGQYVKFWERVFSWYLVLTFLVHLLTVALVMPDYDRFLGITVCHTLFVVGSVQFLHVPQVLLLYREFVINAPKMNGQNGDSKARAQKRRDAWRLALLICTGILAEVLLYISVGLYPVEFGLTSLNVYKTYEQYLAAAPFRLPALPWPDLFINSGAGSGASLLYLLSKAGKADIRSFISSVLGRSGGKKTKNGNATTALSTIRKETGTFSFVLAIPGFRKLDLEDFTTDGRTVLGKGATAIIVLGKLSSAMAEEWGFSDVAVKVFKGKCNCR